MFHLLIGAGAAACPENRRQTGDARGVSSTVAAIDVTRADHRAHEFLGQIVQLIGRFRATETPKRLWPVGRLDRCHTRRHKVQSLVPTCWLQCHHLAAPVVSSVAPAPARLSLALGPLLHVTVVPPRGCSRHCILTTSPNIRVCHTPLCAHHSTAIAIQALQIWMVVPPEAYLAALVSSVLEQFSTSFPTETLHQKRMVVCVRHCLRKCPATKPQTLKSRATVAGRRDCHPY